MFQSIARTKGKKSSVSRFLSFYLAIVAHRHNRHIALQRTQTLFCNRGHKDCFKDTSTALQSRAQHFFALIGHTTLLCTQRIQTPVCTQRRKRHFALKKTNAILHLKETNPVLHSKNKNTVSCSRTQVLFALKAL